MNHEEPRVQLIETDPEWTEQALHSWIVHAQALLELIDETRGDDDLRTLRSLIEGELEDKREQLSTIH